METFGPVIILQVMVAFIGWLTLCGAAAVAGVLSGSGPSEWYNALNKPGWNPPRWIFAPVWTTLYVMMALAVWRVWRCGGWSLQRGPLRLFLCQLALNAAWSPLFFGLHAIGWAAVEIVPLWIFILLTMLAFFRVDQLAGWLLLPYLVWVSFATVLTFTLWWLNR